MQLLKVQQNVKNVKINTIKLKVSLKLITK